MADSAKIPDDVDILHYPVGKSKTINGILKLLRRPWTVTFSPNGKNEFLSSEESVILDLKLVESAAEAEASLRPLELVATTTGGASPSPAVRIVYGTIAGFLPAGFSAGDDPPKVLTGISGGKKVIAKVTHAAGVISGAEIIEAVDLPADTATAVHAEIGSYSVATVANAAYGPISVSICPKYFAPTEFEVTWTFG